MDLPMSHCLNLSAHGSSSTPPLEKDHKVFLSFTRETCRGFTDHLYDRLVSTGIMVLRDQGLTMGERNWPQFVKAINASKISIPVISPDFASSEWCLNELVQILKCKKTLGLLVLPIFYHVKPSDVRKQLDVSEKEYQVYKKRKHDRDGALVQEWKDALEEVSNMTGLESEKIADGDEGQLVEIVVAKVLEALKKPTLIVSAHLVGVFDHMEEIMNMVNVEGYNDASAIVIHGMGGIGKTTLAKFLYNRLAHHFDCCSYLADIRETSSQDLGKEDLQKQLISDILGQKQSHVISNVDEGIKIIREKVNKKKVLIVLDDVDHENQLNALARKRDWFGRGSLLVITSKRKDILEKWEGSFSHEINRLNIDQSFELFCKHAFKNGDSFSDEFFTAAKEIVSTTGGIPLVIEIIGSLLRDKAKDIWGEYLKVLKKIPQDDVPNKLKISFDALQPTEKEIFLDMACLPIRQKREFAMYMWDDSKFDLKIGIDKLISMSLIKIGQEKELIIHDQLRELGRDIVQQESRDELGKRSRLWKEEEAWKALEFKQGTGKIQALVLGSSSYEQDVHCTSQKFEGMTNLGFLHMDNVHLTGDFENHFLNLRWLHWTSYRKFNFMGINFNPKKLVVLELCNCNITDDWKGWSQIKNLKVLKLLGCHHLTTTPDFSTLNKLDVLILNDCWGLRNIHPSICELSKTLKVLDVRCCYELEELPIQLEKMQELRQLLLDETNIKKIPISEGYMTKLEILSAWNCEKLQSLVFHNASIEKSSKLKELYLEGCRDLKSLPNFPSSLMSLRFNGDSMETLPGFSNLTNLNHLTYIDVFKRRNRALNLGNLIQLRTLIIHHNEDFTDISEEISTLDSDSSEDMDVSDSGEEMALSDSAEGMDVAPTKINLLLELPTSLVELEIYGCQTLQSLPNLSNLKNLLRLHLKDCSELMKINGLEGAESLTDLSIVRCTKLSHLNGMGISMTNLKLESLDALESLPHLSTAKKLKDLRILRCRNLVEIAGLDNLKGLQRLKIYMCSSLKRISVLSRLKMLTTLEFFYCEKLRDVQGMEELTSLMSLCIYRCHPEIKFPDLSLLRILKHLTILDEELIEIPGLQSFKSLKRLNISGCKSMQYLPDLSQFKNLRDLDAYGCAKLMEIQGLENLMSLRRLDIRGCKALKRFPDLPAVNVKSDSNPI